MTNENHSFQLSELGLNQHALMHKITDTLLQLFSGIINNLSWITYQKNRNTFDQYKLLHKKFSIIYRKVYGQYQLDHSFSTISKQDIETFQQYSNLLTQANADLIDQLINLLEPTCQKIHAKHQICISQINNILSLLKNLQSTTNCTALINEFRDLESNIITITQTQIAIEDLSFVAAAKQKSLDLKKACLSFKFPHQPTYTSAIINQELIAANQLLKVQALTDYYQSLEIVWFERWKQHQIRFNDLTTSAKTSWRESIRLQRMIDCKLEWISHLEKWFLIYQQSPTWEARIKLASHITYHKSVFFKDFIKTQSAESILTTVHRKLILIKGSQQYLLLLIELNTKNEYLQIKIKKLEQQIYEHQTTAQRLILIFALAGKTLLDKNTGRITSQIPQAIIYQTTTEPWPESWTSYIEYSSALICLLMDMGLMRWTGSSYHLLSAMSHTALIYQETWAPIAHQLDRFFSRQCYDFLRTDELGLIEKRDSIQWILSLFVHLSLCTLFNDAALFPAAIGYCIATALKKITSIGITALGKYQQWTPRTIEFITKCMEFVSYTTGYQISASLTEHYFTSHSNRSHALKILGLTADADPSTFHNQYRLLAKKTHPDICKQCDPTEFQAISKAYEILKNH